MGIFVEGLQQSIRNSMCSYWRSLNTEPLEKLEYHATSSITFQVAWNPREQPNTQTNNQGKSTNCQSGCGRGANNNIRSSVNMSLGQSNSGSRMEAATVNHASAAPPNNFSPMMVNLGRLAVLTEFHVIECPYYSRMKLQSVHSSPCSYRPSSFGPDWELQDTTAPWTTTI